jgi:oligosaccharyl transferase (archaeosortase A-associated)
MDAPVPGLDKNKTLFIAIICAIVIFCAFTLYVRLLPIENLVTDDGVNLLGNDPWYNLRQVEVTVANFPAYAWFDPMTYFPNGTNVPWGPLFTWILSFACIVTGAATRPDMMYISSLIPPLMAVVMVPLVYLIGQKLVDWKTGLLAAGLLAVMPGQFLYRSLFGFADHHIAEVLFSTIFILAYLCVIAATKENEIDLKRPETWTRPAILSIAPGVAFILGYLVMPTMILFALIVAVFSLIQCLINFWRGRPSEYLLIVNTVTFGIAVLAGLILGAGNGSTTLWVYSYGQVIAFLAVILGTAFITLLPRHLGGRPKYWYPLVLAVMAAIAAVVLTVAVPAIGNVIVGSFFSFFGEIATTLTVQEARPWDFDSATSIFQFSLILMLAGFVTLIIRILKHARPEEVLVFVWSGIILFSTIRHVRYEYYVAVTFALLSAVFVGEAISWGGRDLVRLFTGREGGQTEAQKKEEPVKTKGKGKGHKKPQQKAKAVTRTDPVAIAVVIGAILLTGAFVTLAAGTDIAIGSGIGGGIDSDWMDTLKWMGSSLPDPGVDYYAIYDKEGFEYPSEAYGIMSWWDFGHWITFISKKIPNANPFQQGVSGPDGAAAFFIQQSEEESAALLDRDGTRFVVIDFDMDVGKFWAMATWYNQTAGQTPYQPRLLNPETKEGVTVFTDDYYRTIVSRLYNFDGSYTEADTALYLVYRDAAAAGSSIPVLTDARELDADEAHTLAEQYNANAVANTHAITANILFIYPSVDIEALRHFRLVYESPSNIFKGPTPDLKLVKVFEYVPGAVIRGEGVIEVVVQTNRGRIFTYRQQSENGEFVVPYPTEGSPYGTKAMGPYTIEGTGLTYQVSEQAVMEGLTIT